MSEDKTMIQDKSIDLESNVLHITNGDAAVKVMRAAGVIGEILPWRDILHDGPVPGGLDLAELSRRRATFLHEYGFAELAFLRKSFCTRDAMLESCRQFQTVVLWFEHDLYDQLQLLQILSELDRLRHDEVWLVQSDQYLGCLQPADLLSIGHTRQPVINDLFLLARETWAAFRSAEPSDWAGLLSKETGEMPFLRSAVLRHLEQYPHLSDGLNRTQRQILESVAHGASQPWPIFHACQQKEEYQFMGDASFWLYLNELVTGNALTKDSDGHFCLTVFGQELLGHQADWIRQQGLDRWLGGVHLTAEKYWRWDSGKYMLWCNDSELY